MERAIIHLNVADFAVAVERSLDSRLRERPVIIAPEGEARAAVFDMSDEAFRSGVRKGMAVKRALKACRGAAVIAPRMDRYERAMQAFLKCALPYSPRIEATDTQGHVFVDATGTTRLFGSAMDVAWRIRQAARAQLSLDPIWTVAPNKLVAKVASRVVKPVGECLVEAGDEEKFLQPLPIKLLPGLEPDDMRRLREYRLGLIGDLARWRLEQLAVVFGTRGRQLFEFCRGIDASLVLASGQQPPRITMDHEFGEDTNDVDVQRAALLGLVEEAGRRLREQRLAAGSVAVMLDYADGYRAIRQAPPPAPTANDFALFAAAQKALDLAGFRRVRVRHLRLVCARLTFPPAQMDFFAVEDQAGRRQERLVAAMDRIRSRFGAEAIGLGRRLLSASRQNSYSPPQDLAGGDQGEGAKASF